MERINAILAKDVDLVPEFWSLQYKKETAKNWFLFILLRDLFYKRNTVNFFKDRHWTQQEFIELSDPLTKIKLLEVGCGVGNFLLPLVQSHPNMTLFGCDFSKRAIEFVKKDVRFDPSRCTAFECDVTKEALSDQIEVNSIDVVSLIFVLSVLLI